MNVCQFARCFLLWALALLLSPGKANSEPADPQPAMKRENFDRDPHWEGQDNRVRVEKPNPVVQDFGFSRTNYAGGKSPGEIGGRMQRSNTPAFYGLRLDQAKTLDDKLSVSGRFAVTQSGGTSSLYFGWFNSRTPSSRPYNWLGFCLSGEKTGCAVVVGYRTAAGNAGGPGRVTGFGPGWYATPKIRDIHLIPNNGTPYIFEMVYDPDAADGAGQITFTLGGRGPYTGGPFVFTLPAEHRQSGATFDSFGMINAITNGGAVTAFFDDLTIDGHSEPFDVEPQWVGSGNRDRHDDYGREGAHQFGFSETSHAGGRPGEAGGLMYSSSTTPAYYGTGVGQLTLDEPLTASGKIALTEYGSDGALYIGFFDSAKRGHPPVNVLGVLIDGPTSTGPCFRGFLASADPKLALRRRDTALPIAPDGVSHTWRIEYRPETDGGQGRMTVRLDDREDSFLVPADFRKAGAVFNRFGLFVHEGGGRASRVFIDDVEFSIAKK
jgi:hypothetical protein